MALLWYGPAPVSQEAVIRQNFNGSYELYKRLVKSEGILKQSCSELFMRPLSSPRCRSTSPCCTPQSGMAAGCPSEGWVVVLHGGDAFIAFFDNLAPGLCSSLHAVLCLVPLDGAISGAVVQHMV